MVVEFGLLKTRPESGKEVGVDLDRGLVPAVGAGPDQRVDRGLDLSLVPGPSLDLGHDPNRPTERGIRAEANLGLDLGASPPTTGRFRGLGLEIVRDPRVAVVANQSRDHVPVIFPDQGLAPHQLRRMIDRAQDPRQMVSKRTNAVVSVTPRLFIRENSSKSFNDLRA